MAKLTQLIILLFLFFITPALGSWAEQTGTSSATAPGYFDIATGHRYNQNSNGTYNEFSRKGRLLKSGMPCTAAVLIKGRYVRELRDTDYIVYERYQAGKQNQKIVPASQKHPEGWRFKNVLTDAVCREGQ